MKKVSLIIIPIILIFITILIVQNMDNLSNFKLFPLAEAEDTSKMLICDIKNMEDNKAQVVVIVEIDKGIKSVTNPEGLTINANGKEKLAMDYEIEYNKTYDFKIVTNDGTEYTKTVMHEGLENVTGNKVLSEVNQEENVKNYYKNYLGRNVLNYTSANGATDWKLFDVLDDGRVMLIKMEGVNFGDLYVDDGQTYSSYAEKYITYLRNSELDVWKKYVDTTKTGAICYGAPTYLELRESVIHAGVLSDYKIPWGGMKFDNYKSMYNDDINWLLATDYKEICSNPFVTYGNRLAVVERGVITNYADWYSLNNNDCKPIVILNADEVLKLN